MGQQISILEIEEARRTTGVSQDSCAAALGLSGQAAYGSILSKARRGQHSGLVRDQTAAQQLLGDLLSRAEAIIVEEPEASPDSAPVQIETIAAQSPDDEAQTPSNSGPTAEEDEEDPELAARERANAEKAGIADNPYIGLTIEELITAVGELRAEANGAHKGKAAKPSPAEKIAALKKAKQIASAALATGDLDEGLKAILSSEIKTALVCDAPSMRRIWAETEAALTEANKKTPDQEAAEQAALDEEAAAKALAEREVEKARLWARVKDLATDEFLVPRVVRFVQRSGVVGEAAGIIGIYLVVTSRLMADRALCLLRRGAAAGGKNYAVEKVLALMPPEDIIRVSAGSPKAFFYYGGIDNEDAFKGRVIYLAEAAAIAPRGDVESEITMALRTLISEGSLNYQMVDADAKATVQIIKNGPTALLMTSARNNVEEELLTRLLLADADETPEMTRRITLAQYQRAAGVETGPPRGGETIDVELLRDFQRWLALNGPYRVAIPFATSIAAAQARMPAPLRVRRDVGNIIGAVTASAILHSAQRDRDQSGAIIATLDDYDTAFGAFSSGLSGVYAPRANRGVLRLVGVLEKRLHELNAPVRAQRLAFEKKHAGADRGSEWWRRDYPKLIDTVEISYQQLKQALGIASMETVRERVREALAANVIEIIEPAEVYGQPRRRGRPTNNYRLLASSEELTAEMGEAHAMPSPDAVRRMMNDDEARTRWLDWLTRQTDDEAHEASAEAAAARAERAKSDADEDDD